MRSIPVVVVVLCALAGVAGPALPAAAMVTGIASWYGLPFENRRMANGRPFHRHAMTAASRTLPLGSHVRVRWHKRAILVEITDRGPYWDNRLIDLSEGAAARLGIHDAGIAHVEVESVSGPVAPSCR